MRYRRDGWVRRDRGAAPRRRRDGETGVVRGVGDARQAEIRQWNESAAPSGWIEVAAAARHPDGHRRPGTSGAITESWPTRFLSRRSARSSGRFRTTPASLSSQTSPSQPRNFHSVRWAQRTLGPRPVDTPRPMRLTSNAVLRTINAGPGVALHGALRRTLNEKRRWCSGSAGSAIPGRAPPRTGRVRLAVDDVRHASVRGKGARDRRETELCAAADERRRQKGIERAGDLKLAALGDRVCSGRGRWVAAEAGNIVGKRSRSSYRTDTPRSNTPPIFLARESVARFVTERNLASGAATPLW